MNAADAVGYTHNHFVLCCGCVDEFIKPDEDEDEEVPLAIFAQEEGWEEMICDSCRETLGDVEGVA